MRHNSPFSFRAGLAAESRLAYPALFNAAAMGELSVKAVFQSLDVTCGDELANEVAIANLWRG
ncbi:hypothetical protein [Nitrosospira multiformis]|nr:hypothetical protein [Nitrosospira multiformis]